MYNDEDSVEGSMSEKLSLSFRPSILFVVMSPVFEFFLNSSSIVDESADLMMNLQS